MNKINKEKDTVTVIQISDTHLLCNNMPNKFNVEANKNFFAILKKLQQEIKVLDPTIILLTGDLSDDETDKSYEILASHLQNLAIPIYWLPGNHDDVDCMTNVFKEFSNFHAEQSLSTPYWEFIFLNTKKMNSASGYLSDNELNKIERVMQSIRLISKPTAIVMHHHPTPTNTPLIDAFILENSHEFWNVVEKYSDIKLVICGHVHGDYQIAHNNIIVEAAPATCLQWLKGTTELIIERKMGYKIYQFTKDSYRAFARVWEF